jgi:cytochrome P450
VVTALPCQINLFVGDPKVIKVCSGFASKRCNSNHEILEEITSQPKLYSKPVAPYKVLDFFGPSLLTVEGDTWVRLKKLAGPAFSEVRF